jgi:hypothetical protein
MILTFILNLILLFLYGILSPLILIGDVSLPSIIGTSLSTASGYFNSINGVIPVDTMITILGVSLTIEGAYLLFKLIMWVIAKIPTLN